ncbi:MAG: IS66 family transposase [Proteobacteria bacterium]|nr:IS66 family transposase [Pseudomonadota bacterium]
MSKYAEALPLYRLSEMFKRLDVKITGQNMANWMITCSTSVQSLVNLIRDQLYDQPCIHIDESTIQVLKETGKKATSKSFSKGFKNQWRFARAARSLWFLPSCVGSASGQ